MALVECELIRTYKRIWPLSVEETQELSCSGATNGIKPLDVTSVKQYCLGIRTTLMSSKNQEQ